MRRMVLAAIGVSLFGACCVIVFVVRRAGTSVPSDQLRHSEQLSASQEKGTVRRIGHGPTQDAASEVRSDAANETRGSQGVPPPTPTGSGEEGSVDAANETRGSQGVPPPAPTGSGEEGSVDAMNETRGSQSASSLAPSERTRCIGSAQEELVRLRVPWEGRVPTVSLDGNVVTVTFPPPKGMRGGRFIIKMERETKKILDVKIWR